MLERSRNYPGRSRTKTQGAKMATRRAQFLEETIDKVNLEPTRASQIQEHIRNFVAGTQIPAVWSRFLLDVLADPEKVASLRSILAARLDRVPGRDPLEDLLQDHLAPSSSHLDQVGVYEVYKHYLELCRVASLPPVTIQEVESRILSAFPGVPRRFASQPRGPHFCFLQLVAGGAR